MKKIFLLSALAAAAAMPGTASANLLLDLPPILAGQPCCNPCETTCIKPCTTCTTCCGTTCMDSSTTCSICCYGTCSTTTCSDPKCTVDTVATDCGGADKFCCGGQCSDTACQCTEATQEADCGTGNYCCDGVCNATSCPECAANTDCTTGDLQYCSSGRCVECTQNSHCDEANGEQCFSGQCRVPSDSTLNDTGIMWSGKTSTDGNDDNCVDTNQDCGIKNEFSFTASGDCVQDNVTGLTWSPDQGTAVWTGIASKATSAKNSSLCGKTDWRAPTLKELLSIVSYNDMSSTPLVDSSFSITLKTDKPYWSGTSTSDSTKAWGASFLSGWSSQLAKSDSYNVILVSGATTPTPSFSVDDTAGTVTDNNTKLIWTKCLAGYSGTDCGTTGTQTTFTWAEALTYAASAGPDWRLPNLKELQSIVKEDASKPAIDSKFPNANHSVWTSSPSSLTGSVGGVTKWKSWIIDFSSGSIGDSFRDNALRVRLVKDAPAN
ncbi:hypothetical protein GCAAIG_09155 [Candidatus Electronema halotolerans]